MHMFNNNMASIDTCYGGVTSYLASDNGNITILKVVGSGNFLRKCCLFVDNSMLFLCVGI